MDTLIRFHQSHPDWFPLAPQLVAPPSLSPEWEESIRKAYQLGPDEPLWDVPLDTSTRA